MKRITTKIINRMLQEEACKRLARIVNKSYCQAHFKEFASRIDLKIDRNIKTDSKDVVMKNRVFDRLRQDDSRVMPEKELDNFLLDTV